MQQYSAGNTFYEDPSYFGRCDGFSLDETCEATGVSCGPGLLGLDESLDRQLKAASLIPLSDLTAGNSLQEPLEFELDDNGQLLHDMLQQQQQQHNNYHQAPSPTQQQSAATASWEESIHVLQEMLLLQQHQALQCPADQYQSPSFASMFGTPAAILPEITNNNPSLQSCGPKFPGESELLSLLQLPRCAASSMPGSASSAPEFRKQAASVGMLPLYNPTGTRDPAAYHNPSMSDPHILQQPPSSSYPVSLKHLLQNLPPTHANHSNSSTLIHHIDVDEKEPTLNDDGRQFTGSLFDFKRDNSLTKGEPRGINHFATERQRREYLNEKYQTLRGLVPNPTKADRASIVQDAIEYVKELKRTVQELQLLVQDKRRSGVIQKRRKSTMTGDSYPVQSVADMESSSQPAALSGRGGLAGAGEAGAMMDGGTNMQLRSSWLQRTSQHGTQVDVRIVDDEVNIKLAQKKRRNCLLDVVAVLHELRLDLLHANGASIGEHHIFMLNTKIIEGSSTFAGQVAARLIEAVDRHFSNSYGINVC